MNNKPQEAEEKSEILGEDRVLKRLLSTPPQPKSKGEGSASPKKRGRPNKRGLVSDDPSISALRRLLDAHYASLPDPGKCGADELVRVIFGGLPLDIFDAVFLPANGTGSPHLALAFKPAFRGYVAFATEYWLNIISHRDSVSATVRSGEISV